jgi:hypothetical protein
MRLCNHHTKLAIHEWAENKEDIVISHSRGFKTVHGLQVVRAERDSGVLL